MIRIPSLLLLALALVQPLRTEPKVALFGSFPDDDERTHAIKACQEAVDAYGPVQGPRLKLAYVNTGPGDESVTAAAQRVAEDPDILAVVVYGEAGVSPDALAVFKRAHVAVVAATSWAQPRPSEVYTTWLCPGLGDLAETAALYVRHEGSKPAQIAVVDDSSATSAAAARAFAARYRALGGKISYETTWTGGAEDLSPTVRALAAHWPQRVFYTGSAESAGRMLLAMRADKGLKNADLIGLPPLFEPAFFDTTRLKGMRTRALFPCPDYHDMGAMVRDLGFRFQRTSPEYKAYIHYAWRRPGRWAAMLFDGVALAARAVNTVVAQAQAMAAPLSVTASPDAPAPLTAAASGPSATARAAEAAAPVTSAAASGTKPDAGSPGPQLTRENVRLALLGVEGYRGIRGAVNFSAAREPVEPRAMVYQAINRVNRKEMLWERRAYGPPF